MASIKLETPLKIEVRDITEEDLPKLVEIQFAAFQHEAIEHILSGADNPKNRETVIEAHRSHIRSDPGLRIAKAVCDISDFDSGRGPSSVTNEIIVGWSMWYLPNESFKTPAERLPTPLRPSQESVQAPWIDDSERRALAEALIRSLIPQRNRLINGRSCAYVRYMAVHPSFQNQGVGKKLMEWGCKLLDDIGVDAFLQATEGGQRVYSKFGFEKVGALQVDMGNRVGPPLVGMWRKAGGV